MERQSQNPEFRNNSENFHPCTVSSGLNCGLSLYLHPFFMCMSRADSEEIVYKRLIKCRLL